jgi:hypothetical protein
MYKRNIDSSVPERRTVFLRGARQTQKDPVVIHSEESVMGRSDTRDTGKACMHKFRSGSLAELIDLVPLGILLVTVLLCTFELGCSKAGDKVLFGPLSEQDISSLVVPGISKEELFKRCGRPWSIRSIKGIDQMEFLISPLKADKPSDSMIGSFIVVVSNNVVLSWKPSSTVSVR